ncbi:MAG TPA: hypothetical protein VFO93_22230 [Hymenobacter sp.]|uniref:hypothetical protein n=1 Tax=Hymenobacter sp. TaxID=1898978 RepID=UPI002D7F67A8|nr:hypothetical protein [Hymenobacter sp.]HET9506273.1 hypothetical protein [Hymenobacter sp.]
MKNTEISKENVLAALADIDEKGFDKRRQSTKYDLCYNGKRYPPKVVLSVATKFATGRELAANEFYGGINTNLVLENLEFEVIEKTADCRKQNSH